MSLPTDPSPDPRPRRRPRDKPLTQLGELDGISSRGLVIFFIGMIVAGLIAMWIANVVVIWLACGSGAYFDQGVRFKNTRWFTNGQRVREWVGALWYVMWVALMWVWKTISLAIVETMEAFRK
jgi:hypothetical protein